MSLRQGYGSDPPKVEALGTTGKECATKEENEKAKNASKASESDKGAALRKSWDVLMKAIDTHEDRCKAIRKVLIHYWFLLVVITAFTIESYQWLQEDSADISTALSQFNCDPPYADCSTE
ncbi:hypothetical protein L218DRAFT_1008240 [Marasmius fiardii PR-910]|nr:hypothetical protein L218DRAFT_1008240 [Marasmius fiardii PR-910]